MKHANKIIDRAFSYFRIGYNCAESVLLAARAYQHNAYIAQSLSVYENKVLEDD